MDVFSNVYVVLSSCKREKKEMGILKHNVMTKTKHYFILNNNFLPARTINLKCRRKTLSRKEGGG
jgi:hypothetical protein